MASKPATEETFQVTQLLGEGALGKIFLAERAGQRLAIKFLRPELPPEFLQFSRNEAKLLSRLSHPNLVKIFDFYEASVGWPLLDWKQCSEPNPPPGPFIIMEYISGKSLEAMEPLAFRRQAIHGLAQCAQGLHHLHARGFLHRDLKPNNIMLGENGVLKILDFGLAEEKAIDGLARKTMGTLAYMPPESFHGLFDERSDLFSLGVTFYERMTGRLPYDRPLTSNALRKLLPAPPLKKLCPDLADYFCDLIDRLILPAPEQRLRSARSLLNYLRLHDATLVTVSPAAEEISVQKLPLVGRERECKNFEEALLDLRKDSAPPGFCLTGPTGIGRSRLLEEWKWMSAFREVHFISLGPEDSANWLDKCLRRLSGAGDSDLNLRDKMQRLLRSCETIPSVLVFSDLQSWDPGSLPLLSVFLSLRESHRTRILWVLEWNSDLEDLQMNSLVKDLEKAPQVLVLEDLTEEQSSQFLENADLQKAPDEELKKKIFSASSGRPLLILEILQGLIDKGEPKDQVALRALPANLQEASMRRVKALTEAAQGVLGLLLTQAPPVFSEDLENVMDSKSWNVRDGLIELDQNNFLEPRSAERSSLVLRHASLRETFLNALPKELLLEGHRLWLKHWIEEAKQRTDPILKVYLLEHALGANDADEIARASIPGLLALQGLGNFEILSELSGTLDLLEIPSLDHIHLRALRALAFYQRGKYAEALAAYQSWYDLRKFQDDASHLIEVRFHTYLGMVRLAAGEDEEAERELGLAIGAGDSKLYPALRPFHARAYSLLGTVAEKRGAWELARDRLTKALDLGRGDPILLGEAEQRLGVISQKLLDFKAAERHFNRCHDYYEKSPSPQTRAIAKNSLGMLAFETGRLLEAKRWMDQALALANQGGEVLQLARYMGNRANIDSEQGDVGLAAEGLEEARKVLQVLGRREDVWIVCLHGADLYSRMGNLEKFNGLRNILNKEGADLRKLGLIASIHLLDAEDAWRRGDWLRTEERFRAALAEADVAQHPATLLSARIGLMKVHFMTGNTSPNDIRALAEELKSLSGSYYETWSWFVSFLPAPAGQGNDQGLESFVKNFRKLESPMLRIEIAALLAIHFFRNQLRELSGIVWKIALENWKQWTSQLPEEIKMDVEKNRNLNILEKMLQADSLEKPKAEISPAGDGSSREIGPSKISISEERFRHFCEINRQIAQKVKLEEILDRVMDASIELSGAERGFLLLQSEHHAEGPITGYEIKAARRFNKTSLDKEEVKISLSAVQAAMSHGTFLLTDNAQEDRRLREMKSVVQYQLLSILVIPLEIEGKVLGAIYLDHRFQADCFSKEHILMLTAFANQAALALQKALMMEELAQCNQTLQIQVKDQAQHIEVLSEELSQARKGLQYEYAEIVGQSPAIIRVFQLLDHVSKTKIPVWIWGESGTGKELVAKSLHENSPRKESPFVSENCSAIPENLLESELFGHKKGAFSGADRDRVGLFEMADGGTLFLDEVADMPSSMQVKLLRVLQEGEVRPLGSNKKIKVDVRLVTASNKDLQDLVEEGKFRQDLFFRINGLTIPLPPLRQRKEDILLLVRYFIEKISKDYDLPKVSVTKGALDFLLGHSWPGNIRELESAVRNAMLFSGGEALTPDRFAIQVKSVERGEKSTARVKGKTPSNLSSELELERRILLNALDKHKLDKKQVAKALGVSLKSVYARMQRLGIPKKKGVLRQFLKENL